MSVLLAQAPAVEPGPAPPVRHGRCRLVLWINEAAYSVRRGRKLGRGVQGFALRKLDGGQVYAVVRAKGKVSCTCPDSVMRGAVCKHVRALVALGLVSGKGVARA
jgi:hypothetical protein